MRGLPLFSMKAFGQRPGLFGKADIAVPQLAGDELGSPQPTRKMAMDWARTHIQGQSPRNADSGMDVKISVRGLRESFAHGASLPQIQALAALPELIERAVLAETNADRKGRADIKAVHHLYAPLDIGRQLYRVKITVNSTRVHGDKFHGHEIASLDVSRAGALGHPTVKAGAARQARGNAVSVTELLGWTKREDGRPFTPDTAPGGPVKGPQAPMYSRAAQTETPEFKRWFGDWQKAEQHNFLNGTPVASMRGTEVPVFPKITALVEWVADYFSKQHGGKAIHPLLGEVLLDKRAARDSVAHGLSRIKAQGFYVAGDIIEKGRLLDSSPDLQGKPVKWHTVAAPVRIGDKDYIGIAVIRTTEGAQRMYLHEVALKERLRRPSKTGAAAEVVGLTGSGQAGVIRSIVESVMSFNPTRVSKVVDADGEPLVVYHGSSKEGITTFYGGWWSPDPKVTREFGCVASSTSGQKASVKMRDFDLLRGCLQMERSE